MIEFNHINYTLKGKQIIRDLSLKVETGKSLALLGPNGAGKSSLIDMLTGMVNPTRGSALINGQPFNREKAKVGILYEYTPYFYYVTVKEWINYLSAIYGIRRSEISHAADVLRIGELHQKQLQKLSKGERRRVSILAALMHQPSTLILDEPTPDLDPFMRDAVWGLFKRSKRTILFTTHLWDEACNYADTVAFMAKGEILAADTVDVFLSARYLPFKRKVTVNREKMKVLVPKGTFSISENDQVHLYEDNLSHLTDYLLENEVEHTITDTTLKDVYLILNQKTTIG